MPPRRRGRPRRGPNPDPEPKRNEQVAQFAAPAPEGEAPTPLFADKMAVVLSRIERAVNRDALNYYVVGLRKRIRALTEMGCPVDVLNQRIAIINGGDSLGSGMYSRFTEQMSIGDQAQLQLEDERRAQEAEATATRDILLKLTEMPAMPAGTIDTQLLAYVRTWPSVVREAVIEYATTVNALPEGETFEGDVPKHVRMAVDRAIEWTMPEDEIRHWLTRGPYRASWWIDGAKKTWWYAELTPKTIGPPVDLPLDGGLLYPGEPIVEHGLFETEPEAQRCAARLNRLAALDKDINPPTAS